MIHSTETMRSRARSSIKMIDFQAAATKTTIFTLIALKRWPDQTRSDRIDKSSLATGQPIREGVST